MSTIGDTIQDIRRRNGWDQAELVRRIGGVTQQTVSKWERGVSRPARAMIGRLALALGVDAGELLRQAGYVSPLADNPSQVAKPIRPLALTLPLEKLPEETFEDFSADLVRCLHPAERVSRFGSRGDKQFGVDGVAVRADGTTAATFQSKRHKQFGPEKVRQAVDAVGIDADRHYLLLTRPATPGARLAVQKYPKWTLLDVEDISRIVRSELSADERLRIVDAYFPGWRQDFLGIAGPSPWITYRQQVERFGIDRLYNFGQTLRGRTEILEAAQGFLSDSGASVAMLAGRGGIGKTRVLHAIAEQAVIDGFAVRFLADTTAPEHFETLPNAKLVVVIDDAHARSDTNEVLASVLRYRPSAKVLLAIRPHAQSLLVSQLRGLGVHATECPVWTLGDLSRADNEALAAEVLGAGAETPVVQTLARIAPDCPLITVIGGALIRRGKLSPNHLESSPTIRDEIMHGFRDSLMPGADRDHVAWRNLIDALSILQPFDTSDQAARETIEALSGVPFDRVVPMLRAIEDAGVLLRRGSVLRIIPDLLGDVILREACFDERSGHSTGYVERAFKAANGASAQHVFVNASRADWQVRQGSKISQPMVENLWSVVEAEFRSADIRGRVALLDLVEKVAYFQPEESLRLVRWAIDNPTEHLDEPDDVFGRLYQPTAAEVRYQAGAVLRVIAYDYKNLVATADLLWQLATDDSRPTNQYPNHPMRVLKELASISVYKPLDYSMIMVERVAVWLGEDKPHFYSPLEVVEPVLATEGMDHEGDALSIRLKPFAINIEAVAQIRNTVLDLAFAEIESTDLRRAGRGVETVGAALHYPQGYSGNAVPAEVSETWTAPFIQTIVRLGKVARGARLDPAIQIKVRTVLSWHEKYSPTATRAAAKHAVSLQRATIENELAVLLLGTWHQTATSGTLLAASGQSKVAGFSNYLKSHRGTTTDDDYEGTQNRLAARCRDFADLLRTTYSPASVIDMIERRLHAAAASGGTSRGNSGYFVWTLVELWPEAGLETLRRVAAAPDSALTEIVSVALARLAETRPTDAIRCARELLAAGDETVEALVASAFGWNRGSRVTLLPGEWDLLLDFAAHPSVNVRAAAVRAADVLTASDPARALTLLIAVSFRDSSKLADDIFSCFGESLGLSWSAVAKADQETLLAELTECPSLDEHHLTQLLDRLSRSEPLRTLKLLTDRIEKAESEDPRYAEYRPLPHTWNVTLAPKTDREQLLGAILDWMLVGHQSWRRAMDGPKIFRRFAGAFDSPVLNLLERFVVGQGVDRLDVVASVLREAPEVTFDNVDFVTKLLRLAAKHGEKHLQLVGGALHSAAVSGFGSAAIGQPFPRDVTLRDRAEATAETLPVGSIEARFYSSLAESARRNIEWQTQSGEKLLDGRDWGRS